MGPEIKGMVDLRNTNGRIRSLGNLVIEELLVSRFLHAIPLVLDENFFSIVSVRQMVIFDAIFAAKLCYFVFAGQVRGVRGDDLVADSRHRDRGRKSLY